MYMTSEIIQLVDQEIKLADNELNDFKTLIEAATKAAQDVQLVISEERLLRLGVHLVAVIRRANSGEVLPPVDEIMLQQVAADMHDLARKVLGATLVTKPCQEDSTEVLLLAVHFAAAKESI
jgi:PRD domain protein (TIGR03582 family)